jgi:hypothetical protein
MEFFIFLLPHNTVYMGLYLFKKEQVLPAMGGLINSLQKWFIVKMRTYDYF